MTYRIVSILLLSIGMYEILAALIGLMFWLVFGDWRSYLPQILLIAFWVNWPSSYAVWHYFLRQKDSR